MCMNSRIRIVSVEFRALEIVISYEHACRPVRRREDNIETGLQGVICGNKDWIELALDRDG